MNETVKLSHRQIGFLCESLFHQLHGGISLADGVFLMAEDVQGPLGPVLKEIGRNLDAGMEFSRALEQAGCFPVYLQGMVQVAERTGKLEQTLQSLAAFYDRRHQTRRQIQNALRYPCMVFGLMLLVVGVLLTEVLPVFERVYASLGSSLTGLAAVLLALGQGIKAALPVILACLIALAVFGLFYAKSSKCKKTVNGWYQIHWGDRGIARKFHNVSFAQAVAMGMTSGLTLEESMDLSQGILADAPAAQERCRKCTEAIRAGKNLPEAMADAQLLDLPRSRLLAVGIRGGSGDRVMEEIARQLGDEAEEAMEDRVSRIEPAMVLTASLLVGAILLAVLLPLINIMQSIG